MRCKYFLGILLLVLSSVTRAQEAGMAGEWTVHYQTLRAFDGELVMRIERGESGYRLTVISSNEHYPARESEILEEFRVGDDTIRWGPSVVSFSGRRDGDFVAGEISGRQENVGVTFGGHWIAVRTTARRD